MKKKLNILLDYKGRFETRYTANPYRGGMDKELLRTNFQANGFEVNYLFFHEIDLRDKSLNGQIFLYCSSEDKGGYLKSYVEDFVLALKWAGAIVVPDYLYLRAHNNKVFMEMLRDLLLADLSQNIRSKYYGTRESLLSDSASYSGRFPLVLKPSEGSMSKGVVVARNFEELKRLSVDASRTLNIWARLKDSLRKYKHPGYLPDSNHRKKFVVQNMVEGLAGDWKVLIFGSRYYVLKRENRKNDFRASGGGRLSYTKEIPAGMLDYAEKVLHALNVPNLSIDIGSTNEGFFLFEFQCLYFGSYTLEHSDYYFIKNEERWETVNGKSILEEEYCRSISTYIDNLIN